MVGTRRRSARLQGVTDGERESVQDQDCTPKQKNGGAENRPAVKARKRESSPKNASVEPPRRRSARFANAPVNVELGTSTVGNLKDKPSKSAVVRKKNVVLTDSAALDVSLTGEKDTPISTDGSDQLIKCEDNPTVNSEMELFGDTSDEEDVNTGKKKLNKTRKTASAGGSTKSRTLRRSAVQCVGNSFKEASSSSSSSDDSASSDFESHLAKEEEGSDRSEVSEELVQTSDSEDNWDDIGSSKKTNGARSARKSTKKISNSNSRSKATSRATGATNTKPSNPRIAVKKKPAQPWQVANAAVVGDITVPPRKMNTGDRKMLEFRLFAASLATGRALEITMDECSKIVKQMKEEAAAKRRGKMQHMTHIDPIEMKKDCDESSSDDDDWEEMEPVGGLDTNVKLEVTIEKEVERDWWALYLRQEVNRNIRHTWESTHKAHLLCYIGHLQFILKVVVDDEKLVPSLMLTQMPENFMRLIGEPISLKHAKNVAEWFKSSFKPSMSTISVSEDDIASGKFRFTETARFASLVDKKSYETDMERAALLFSAFVALECLCRLCVNTIPISRKWDEVLMKEWSERSTNSCRLDITTTSAELTSNKSSKKKKADPVKSSGQECNYWVEYWNATEKRWICVDPVLGIVDDAATIEKNCTKPISYVFAIDNKYGVRDVSARYASDFVRQEFRRRRTAESWLKRTLNLDIVSADKGRAELEDIHFRTELVRRPLPATISEFKNHPLYVLERDLLKFEGIYPPPSEQKPLGVVRGHNVYPRDTVYTLQAAKNWEKLARSVKDGEKAYKVVKARPNLFIPAEEREQKYLDVFGFWQTEPFRRLKVENGRIPRNEYGNVYMYQESMCPIGAVHLRLPCLPQIARRLNKECIPAIVGWDFHNCGNYPYVDGACVLEEDADLFISEWKKQEAGKEMREKKKRDDRIYGNWKKLIRGIIRLQFVKNKFGGTSSSANIGKKGKAAANGRNENSASEPAVADSGITDMTKKAGHGNAEFTLEDMMQF